MAGGRILTLSARRGLVPGEVLHQEPVMAEQHAGSSNPMPGRATAAHISVEEFTEATFNAVLRAIDARQFPHGPIIYGIWYLPQGVPIEQVTGAGEVRAAKGGA
jgi:hypothetical protein